MRLSTRLIVVILPIVTLVMGVTGAWFLQEQERVLVPEMQQQTRAYARSLDIAFEFGLRDLDSVRVAAIVNRTAANARVSGIRVYDAQGRVQYRSTSMISSPHPPDSVLASVLHGRSEAVYEHSVNGESAFSVLRVIRDLTPDDSGAGQGTVLGALEVTQPYALLLEGLRRLQLELTIVTLLLLLAVTMTIAFVSPPMIARPLEQLVGAARALGEGDIDSRVPESLGAAEPNALAREFNVMATRLAGARRELLREGEERVRLERRLAEAEKLATVGTLAAGLAHEIGAPLNVISGRAEMLLEGSETSPALARHLQSIITQSGRITRTVRSLLDYARRPARHDEPFALNPMVDATIELLDAELRKAGVRVERKSSSDPWVRGDADQLQQVMTNLILNALQAMDGQPGPHTITIETGRTLSSNDAAAEAVIAVLDTGPGLSSELDGRLFTPFATTKQTGTGLGLVVARSIAQDHGGTLDGTTRTDGIRGACFIMKLPMIAAPVTVSSRIA